MSSNETLLTNIAFVNTVVWIAGAQLELGGKNDAITVSYHYFRGK